MPVKEMDIKEKKSGIKRDLTKLTTLPILILGIVLIFVIYFRFYQVISEQIAKELDDITIAALYSNSDLYDDARTFTRDDNGIYTMDAIEGEYRDYNKYLDYIKAGTGIDTTLFYYDIRVATTIMDESGNRLTGTTVSKNIVDTVIATGNSHFFDDVDIFGRKFSAVYRPVYNSSGDFTGMIFAGRPNAEVKKLILVNTWPIILAAIVMMIVVVIGAGKVAYGYADTIDKIKRYLNATAKGDFKANLDANVIKRKDELGEMGLITVRVQKYMRDMVEKDALTKLYCRRIGELKFAATQNEYIESGVPYCVVMGDIDHFKKFNDTYGHDCGDLVLQSVASVFNRMVFGHGYAVRWGGEEFIMVFDNCDIEKGVKLLNSVRDAVLENEVIYKEEILKITMTYGIVSGDERPVNAIMKDVDNLLYVGKQGGRNRIVVGDEELNTTNVSENA